MRLKITDAIQQEISRHAEEAFPNECCGFFFTNGEKNKTVTEFLRVENSKEGDQRRRFEVHPMDYMKAENYAVKNGLNLMGVYHSHPNHPAIPSEHDLRQAVPYFSYIIVSVMEGKTNDFRSWRLNQCTKEFDEEQVTINKLETIKV